VSLTRYEGGIVFAFKDVTDERRLESMRNDLIATVSHELRTPVTAVYGAVKTLERPDVRGDDGLSSQLFDIVKSESTRLVQLVEEILLASNLDSGNIRIETEGVDVREVVEESVSGFATGGAAASVTGESRRVLADRHRLHQVLANLVDNGLKYGGGQVEVSIGGRGDDVLVSVADRGPGIAAADRARVFEKFVRLDPNMRSGVNGTGLGLYISRELVLRMGGRMWVEPRADGASGAVFVVALPAC
jgi:signal transduction histidine kinase